MSGGIDVLALDEGDVTKMLVAATHIGNYIFFSPLCTAYG